MFARINLPQVKDKVFFKENQVWRFFTRDTPEWKRTRSVILLVMMNKGGERELNY